MTCVEVLVIQIEEVKTEVPHTSGINTRAGVSAQLFTFAKVFQFKSDNIIKQYIK